MQFYCNAVNVMAGAWLNFVQQCQQHSIQFCSDIYNSNSTAANEWSKNSFNSSANNPTDQSNMKEGCNAALGCFKSNIERCEQYNNDIQQTGSDFFSALKNVCQCSESESKA